MTVTSSLTSKPSIVLKEAVQRATKRSDGSTKIGFDKLLGYAEKTIPYLIASARRNVRDVTYSQVAEAIGSGNPRHGNRAFGAFGQVRQLLADTQPFKDRQIPDLTLLVQHKGRRSIGKGAFHANPELTMGSNIENRAKLEQLRKESYDYPHWDELLAVLGLSRLTNLEGARSVPDLSGEQGESALHKRLKELVSLNPTKAGLQLEGDYASTLEYPFWSQDRMDVSLETPTSWVGVEVKTSDRDGDEDELRRGVFQVVKYRALMEATLLMKGEDKQVLCYLALGGSPTNNIIVLTERLNVKMVIGLEHIFQEDLP